ncbi:MAG: GNAT family N-acetyltransferase, partial [Mycobacteriales bacterium]
FVGWCSLRPGDGTLPTEAELGYRRRRVAWGKGYATELSEALLRRAFIDAGVLRVFATTMTVNTGSRRVMEKIGLRFIRTFHLVWPEPIEGTEFGDVEYALTRPQWREGLGARTSFGVLSGDA